MGTSKPNQIRYNDKISKIRVAINQEKLHFVDAVQKDIQSLLERRSPVDMGDLKKSWRVVITNKHKLAGHSLAKLSQVRPISLGISVESTSRHAIMQMFGWEAKPGQLLTGYKKSGNKWHILRASRPIFKVSDSPKKRRTRKGRIRSFITRGGKHSPDSNLAFEGGAHSIKVEIKRIIARRLKECKYLGSVTFLTGDVAKFWTGNKVVGRIAQWMSGTLSVELNSVATAGLPQP
jgi:hypothetical protein